jgi:hypothetical protein
MKDAGLSHPKAKRDASPDPLGKRALFSVPIDADAGASAVVKHPGYSNGDPEPGISAVTKERRSLGRSRFTVRCQRCRQISRVSAVDLLIFQWPIGVWLPRGQFDRRMTCPSCRKRSWCSVSLRRDQ